MTLAAVTTGKQESPPRVLVFGTEGIGKSTFGANAPAPVFLPAEDGTRQMDVSRLPTPEAWPDVLDAVRLLTTEKHDYKTFVVDTLDAVEPLLWRYICERDGEKSIESYGYGKGYTAALDEWRVFLAALEAMRRAKPDMGVVLLAHSQIKAFKNPEGEDFDRYQMKLNEKAGALLREWCDAALFAAYETLTVTSDSGKAKGVSTGARILHTQRTAAWDAKNRYSLPETLPLDYGEFTAAVSGRPPEAVAELRAAIETEAGQLADTAKAAKALAAAKVAGNDVAKLNQIKNHLTALLAEQSKKGA
jgi:hypothetical protein